MKNKHTHWIWLWISFSQPHVLAQTHELCSQISAGGHRVECRQTETWLINITGDNFLGFHVRFWAHTKKAVLIFIANFTMILLALMQALKVLKLIVSQQLWGANIQIILENIENMWGLIFIRLIFNQIQSTYDCLCFVCLADCFNIRYWGCPLVIPFFVIQCNLFFPYSLVGKPRRRPRWCTSWPLTQCTSLLDARALYVLSLRTSVR